MISHQLTISSHAIHVFILPLLVALAAIASTNAQGSHNSSNGGGREVGHAGGDDGVYLYSSRLDYYIDYSKLTLECDTRSNNVHFFRENGSTAEEITFPRDTVVKTISFTVTPEREGRYYCTGGGVRSEPAFVEIVAYPIPNSTVMATRTYKAPLSSEVTIPCAFSPGTLYNRYTIVWYKGLIAIDTSNPRFEITPDFALVIKSVNALDASSAYYCVVDVRSEEALLPGYHSIGPSMELVVTASPFITHPPLDSLHLPSTSTTTHSAIFKCVATGLPPPSITWLHRGLRVSSTRSSDSHQVYASATNTTVDVSGATAVSNMYITAIEEGDSGLVECIAIQNSVGDEDMIMMSASARLSVLPSSFTPNILPTSDGVELLFSLPILLPTSFSLLVHYYDTDNLLFSKSELVSTTFANSDSVDYIIAEDKLPSLETFSVRVSVKVGDLEGELSQPSNVITVQRSVTGPKSEEQCSCSEGQTGTDTSVDDAGTVQTVLVIFIVLLTVLLTIAVGVALWGVAMMIRRMKRGDRKDHDRSYSPSRSSYRSRSRSRSRSRYRSSSRSRSRSSSYSRSRSISIGRSYRSDSEPRGLTPFDYEGEEERRGVALVGVAPEGREDPEGSDAECEYIILKSAPSEIRSRAGSTVSSQPNSIVARPLPSVPYEQRPIPHSIPQDKENQYEEVKFKKTKKKKRNREGEMVGEGVGAQGEEGGAREGEGASGQEPVLRLEPGLEEVSVV